MLDVAGGIILAVVVLGLAYWICRFLKGSLSGVRRSWRDKKQLESLRFFLKNFTDVIGVGGIVLMIRLGSRIRRQLEKLTPESSIGSDKDLEDIVRVVDAYSVEELAVLAQYFALMARDMTPEDAEEHFDDEMVFLLLSGWVSCKRVVRGSTSKSLSNQAYDLESVFFLHIKRLLRIVRGDSAVPPDD